MSQKASRWMEVAFLGTVALLLVALILLSRRQAPPSSPGEIQLSADGGYHRPPEGLSPIARELYCATCHQESFVHGAKLLTRGRQLIRRLSCASCHELPAGYRPESPPALAPAAASLTPAALAEWVREPDRFSPGSAMPAFELRDKQVRKLATILSRLAEEGRKKLAAVGGLKEVDLSAGDPDYGAELAAEARCFTCHQLPGEEPFPAHQLPGPSLARVALKLTPQALAAKLLDPTWDHPQTRMPPFDFEPDEVADLVAFLLKESGGEVGGDDPPTSKQRGKVDLDQLGSFGCLRCHSISPGEPPQPVRLSPEPLARYSLLAQGKLNDFPWEDEGRRAELEGRVRELAGLISHRQLPPTDREGLPTPRYRLSEEDRLAVAVALAGMDLSGKIKPKIRRKGETEAVSADLRTHWLTPIPPQGLPADWLSPIETSLSATSCARCHPEQYEDWQGSRHAKAYGPGFEGQIIEWVKTNPSQYASCITCHAPLSEQSRFLLADQSLLSIQGRTRFPPDKLRPNPAFDHALALEGINCAACHLRDFTRIGPVDLVTEVRWDRDRLRAHPKLGREFFASAEFCFGCHQFDDDQTIEKKGGGEAPPLENTFREWQASLFYPETTCISCHLPAGRHLFRGIHDPETVGKAVEVGDTVRVEQGRVVGELSLTNREVGHMLPTYVTPQIHLVAEFLGRDGKPLKEGRQVYRVAREVVFTSGKWVELADRRLAPGETARLSLDQPIPKGAKKLHLYIRVLPDNYYFFAYMIWIGEEGRSEESKVMLRRAMEEAHPDRSGYYLYQRTIGLP